MNVLVTGISGFVGTNLVSYFKEDKDVKVFGLSRKKNLEVPYLNDFSSRTLDEYQINVVIHLAGIAHDLSNQFNPEDYYRVNYEATKDLVDEVLKSNVAKFIFVSSIKALCDTSSVPAKEEMNPTPTTDYGKSKLKAEEYIQSKEWKAKSFYILRPGMIHGSGNKGNLNLLYRFAKTGLPFPFAAFHNQRSFHSIDNFCFVVESIIEKEITSGIYHLADEGFLSTTELYQLISEALKKKPSVWKIPISWIQFFASITGKKAMVTKLTDNMMISNQKIISAIGSKMPVELKQGLIKTIYSFDGK
jgi:nucleoside-diphosphate-sugar epimerase